MRKPKKVTPPTPAIRLKKIAAAGLKTEKMAGLADRSGIQLPELSSRVLFIESLFASSFQPGNNHMLFFVMYDIEDHRIRRHIAKYLQRNGCERLQKSVFLGSSPQHIYREIAQTLSEINSMYQNKDSIMLLPVSRESMMHLKVIGKDLHYKLIVQPPNVLII